MILNSQECNSICSTDKENDDETRVVFYSPCAPTGCHFSQEIVEASQKTGRWDEARAATESATGTLAFLLVSFFDKESR